MKIKQLFVTIVFCSLIVLLFEECNTHTTGAETTITPVVEKEHSQPAKDQVTEAYCYAITEYIKAIYKNDKPVPDTLYIGKNADFPDITLPATIQKTNILLLTMEEADQRMQSGKPMVYLNVVGWIEKEKSEFIIVTFFEGGKPQHNCHVYFKRNSTKNEFEMDSLKFEYKYNNGAPVKK